ncbi:hypothetical protein GGX14DRAFT_406306 [Mycena pura]|uniref:Uncharacterized protein n=1 Tax=Mycena pura TaxID=153505 RepID=A0AAD6USB1_9AGAR|nr:hypothetical protein GGX14DRAFT_406306 [Mycena pura]
MPMMPNRSDVYAPNFGSLCACRPLCNVGVIPDVSIRALDPPEPLGTLIVFRAPLISSPRGGQLASSEASATFANLTLPRLGNIDASPADSVPAPSASRPAESRLSRHNAPGAPPSGHSYMHFSGTRLAAYVLASPHPFPDLRCSRYIVGRPHRRTTPSPDLHLHGWTPWDARRPADVAGEAPERGAGHVAELGLTDIQEPKVRDLRSERGTARIFWMQLTDQRHFPEAGSQLESVVGGERPAETVTERWASIVTATLLTPYCTTVDTTSGQVTTARAWQLLNSKKFEDSAHRFRA